jgi:hypothetical protein
VHSPLPRMGATQLRARRRGRRLAREGKGRGAGAAEGGDVEAQGGTGEGWRGGEGAGVEAAQLRQRGSGGAAGGAVVEGEGVEAQRCPPPREGAPPPSARAPSGGDTGKGQAVGRSCGSVVEGAGVVEGGAVGHHATLPPLLDCHLCLTATLPPCHVAVGGMMPPDNMPPCHLATR